MTADEPRKVFLSHKSSDKALVIDFKETLDLLGYETWLDEEAMPAGTTLERGLLQGMQESCAVVFFITSSFEDEGYLETEINYAIQEKRDKGGEFSIITLLLKGDDDETAPIPDLLRPYVWKTPRTHLEALREIIRALPIVPGNGEWRNDITESGAESDMMPISELTDQAVELLLNAANSDGRIMYARAFLGRHKIEIGRRVLVSSREDEVAAPWVNALAELAVFGYINQVKETSNETLFVVTSQGYDAVDEIGA